MLIDHPVEEPPNKDQQRPRHLRCAAALLGVDDLQHIELVDLADRSLAPDGDEVGAQVALSDLAAPLLRQLVGDEVLGHGGERMPDFQGALAVGLLTGFVLDHLRVHALVDQGAPLACDAPRFLQRHRAIGADGSSCRCRPPREPRVQDEGDATGLAPPRRVGVLNVMDANAKAGDGGGVPDLKPCPGWGRSKGA